MSYGDEREISFDTEKLKGKVRGKRRYIVVVVVAAVLFILGGSILETNKRGQFQFFQRAVSGKLGVKATPGTWFQLWADVDTWNKAYTLYYTADRDGKDDTDRDMSIEVRFIDGSICYIEGTLRADMPTLSDQIIYMINERSFSSYQELEEKLLRPALRNAFRLTANMMTARESYAEKRQNFIYWARDQIDNGLYVTRDSTRKVLDLISGEETTKTFKVIEKDASGNPIYEANPLEGLGLTLSNLEIKRFRYADKVMEQIAAQQEAQMNVATAAAKAAEAEQNALTAEAKGKEAVMIAKYEEEEKKIRATVEAEKVLEVNTTLAKAALQKEAELKALGRGESARKRMNMEADGALEPKLQAVVEINKNYANAIKEYKGNWVPLYNWGGPLDGTQGNGAMQLIDLLTAKTAKDLNLDMTVQNNK